MSLKSILYEAITYTINIYNDNRELVETKTDIAHKSNINIADATKAETGYATYVFTGWVDETGNPVDLTSITSDLDIYPTFKAVEKEYRFGFTNSNNLDSISVSVGGEKVTLNDTYHYGSTIRLRATAKTGNEITEFKVTVNGTTTDVLTYANRVEEDGKVYYEIELIGNGDLTITYTESLLEYSLTIPSGVTVKREGKTLESGVTIKYGDELEITYTESEGHHKTDFRLEWAEHMTGDLWKVIGDLNIIYAEERNEYSLGSIPSGVIVKRGTEVLNSNSKIYYGDQLTFTYTETSNRYTGNTKQEAGYNYSEKETTTYVLKVNSSVLSNGSTITVSDNIALELSSSTSLSWEQSSRIEYSLGTIPSGVTVKRGSTTLSNNATIYYGDTLTFTYTTSSTRNTGNTKQEAGYNYSEKETTTYTLKANNSALSSGSSVNVTGNITLSLTSTSSLSWEQGSRITYSLGTIPSGVTVRRNGSTLSSNATIYYGDSLTISYTLADNYELKEFKVNNQNFTNGGTHSVTGNVSIIFTYEEVLADPYTYLIFSECDGGYEVSEFNKNSNVKDIVIPATYNGQPVVGIKDSNSGQSGVFYSSGVTSVTIEEGVKSIGKNAFYYCWSLKSIIIPSSINNISSESFNGCSGITSIIVADRNSVFTSKNNSGIEINCIINKENKELLKGCKNSVIPTDGSVTKIGSRAFVGVSFSGELVIPSNVTSIGSHAFYHTSMDSLTIQEGVKSIGFQAFSECGRLKSVYIPSTVNEINTYAFSSCRSLTEVTIASNEMIEMEGDALAYCSNLTSVTFLDINGWKVNDVTFDVSNSTQNAVYFKENRHEIWTKL